MESSLLFAKHLRRKAKKTLFKKELLNYIFVEYQKGHVLSRREIEGKFHLRLNSFFKNIDSVYQELGIKYQLSPNQEIKSNKANLLLKIILANLSKFNLKLLDYRNVTDRGIDILCKEGNNLVGIELKAYKKEEKLKSRDIRQVERAIKNENLSRAILITTTDKSDITLNLPSNISLLKYQSFKNLIESEEQKKDLDFIRETSVNYLPAYREMRKQLILDYVSKKYIEENKKPGPLEISRDLHLKVYTYFHDVFEIYKILKIPPPLKNMNGRNSKNPDKECIALWKNEFKKYILEIIRKEKRYPSGIEIGRHFGISHIWNLVNVSELYAELNLKSYLERTNRLHTFEN